MSKIWGNESGVQHLDNLYNFIYISTFIVVLLLLGGTPLITQLDKKYAQWAALALARGGALGARTACMLETSIEIPKFIMVPSYTTKF